MNALTTKAVAGLGVAGALGTASAGAWYVSRPKDVKSKLISEGLTLVGSSSKAWRSVFLTHNGDSEFMSFAGVESGKSDKEAGSKVMSACEGVMKVSVDSEDYNASLDKARKYRTAPNFKTIEAKVLFSDREIAFEDRDWKNLFTIHKGDDAFIEKVKKANSDTSLTKDSTVDTVKDKVKKFCDDLKVQSPNSGGVADYEKYCLQTPSSARIFYENLGTRFVGESGWGSKFDSIKASDNAMFEDIKGTETLNASSPSDKGGSQLRAWCDKEVVKELSDSHQKTRDRCFN
ncbi:hypothetical protein MHF_1072 [Mycoplasma haemofelis Ohio2]|uniref:Uncharacterized protein n=1 Tax=Mycoplasma haemofelis (strain Ohio2) TaxID=859194 RepID=F6FJG7_MYCHI|nr:hypothetical protein MHF_1072 [Mycoplasma haemofelis Ohio2]